MKRNYINGKEFAAHFVQHYIKDNDIAEPEKIGTGIFLIKSLMEEVEYAFSINKGLSASPGLIGRKGDEEKEVLG